MRLLAKTATAITAAGLLAACSPDPRNFETDPVRIDTPKGAVTCQLYTDQTVVWDRAIAAPAGMSIQEADKICVDEGYRRMQAS
ncbi:hypothetical protein SAMN05444007_11738 [Cribrihabitans marinus]|uniref:Uncharacterized protein n=1 Tax=Cribrihabitans marinus TaxID=1227549 RepID=A0A1H7DZD5_9RHOB|nr:hypothetical protein [Cribrihabitans marinus]GGH17915.1 hypothetical protein GCM10010973_00370 [Cribrihabitans marinus]SEK07071.1 hypothetical protein SAMN05444007_11738 [Cribrihabitans marinus]